MEHYTMYDLEYSHLFCNRLIGFYAPVYLQLRFLFKKLQYCLQICRPLFGPAFLYTYFFSYSNYYLVFGIQIVCGLRDLCTYTVTISYVKGVLHICTVKKTKYILLSERKYIRKFKHIFANHFS